MNGCAYVLVILEVKQITYSSLIFTLLDVHIYWM
jgi:hypothetical protein